MFSAFSKFSNYKKITMVIKSVNDFHNLLKLKSNLILFSSVIVILSTFSRNVMLKLIISKFCVLKIIIDY